MNSNIAKLYAIAQKPERLIIGLMSGTSLDGLDVALCRFTGSGLDTKVSVINFQTIGYQENIRQKIKTVFAKKTIDFQHLCLLNEWLGSLHGEIVLACLEQWNVSTATVDLIASHGQTVFHAPKRQHGIGCFPNGTLQIGDADHLAVKTGIITLADFRQKHLAAGGEGAPLAVYGDYFLFSKRGENRIMLNIGGIGNFTFLPQSGNALEIFTTDTGTGNTLIDAFVQHFDPSKPYDYNGEMAENGHINHSLLKMLKNHDFFAAAFPKTTGPELFNVNYVQNALKNAEITTILPNDLIATLTQFSAETIAEAIQKTLEYNQKYTVYISGGGMHNPVLVGAIRKMLPQCIFSKTNDLGIDGNAKEAVLFATLANESIAGNGISFGNRQDVPSVCMGKISFPH